MLKQYTAFTKEIDDAKLAVKEIIEQLNLQETMLKNTVGIVQFFSEFAETGVLQAISEALPFELVGCSSLFTGTRESYGDFSLCITMLTSDDVDFAVKTIEDVYDKPREQVIDAVNKIANELCEKESPKVVLSFLALTGFFSGEDFVAAINSLPNPFPVFGTVAFCDDKKKEVNIVVKGNKISFGMHAFIALYGNVDPKFHVTTAFAFEEINLKVSQITDAEGSLLKMVDGVTAVEFLKAQGFINQKGEVANSSVWAVPAVLTNPNGVKVARAFLGVMQDTPYVYSAGNLTPGAKISFASLNGEKTLSSASKLFGEIDKEKENDILAFSCAARLWALSVRFADEAKTISEQALNNKKENGKSLNYSLAYSGAEICPVKDSQGKYINVLHNYTLICCAFNSEK